ncbi:DUF4159 domain-containing protein [Candidatus Laterigemmans baculatus]|uniref:DUF4159 domain-containing protein n=1 Tax=Candidatus Laterigemmans baculatus TaxID=2770505 RepID=UPI0013DB5C4D|nr:DUF4159 domain-containing protein [Candidatus Laterigemmans baculatus]
MKSRDRATRGVVRNSAASKALPLSARRLGVPLLMVALALLEALFAPGSAHAQITAAEVETSIRRGIQYLQNRQLANGGWDEYPRHEGGLSSLCTLALVNAGVPVDDPSITKATQYLRAIETQSTYSVSLQTMAFCEIGAAEDLPRIRRNVRWLEREQIKGDTPRAHLGAWSYYATPANAEPLGGDPSNTQFALLALAAAEERGVTVSSEAFELAAAYWDKRQRSSGGWAYSEGMGTQPSGSMTCAGIASTIICRGRLSSGGARIDGDTIECCGEGADDEDIERALEWLGERFTVRSNPGPRSLASNLFYYLYALERVGRMSGRRLIGGHDWYREGAEYLLGVQDDFQGFWAGVGPAEANRSVTTSFALLFLSKGKRQVVLGRLQYGEGNQWQQHPEAVRQLVRHVERDWGRSLTWQTVQLEGASVADLLQTPVILIAGQQPLAFDAAERQLLKGYVDAGGFLLFEATAGDGCGDPAPFERSVSALCEELFDSPLERLPPTHPLWFAERRVDPALLGKDFWVYGVQACCRTGVAYLPKALTCRWELSDPAGRTEYPDAIGRQIEAAVAMGQNIIAYATGRELKEKLEMRSVLAEDSEIRPGDRGVITIPQLALDAGGEEAQRAVPNLMRYLSRDVPVRIATEAPQVPIAAEPLQNFPILWVHGRRGFRFTDQEVEVLRTYIENGGTLLIDSICGDDAFTASVREEIDRLLPKSQLEPLPIDHPLMTSSFGGFDLSTVTLRIPVRGTSGALNVQKRQTTAVLEAATVEDRVVVLFSPYDLSCALESQNSIQCPGYSTEDAAKIGINMVLYALLQ